MKNYVRHEQQCVNKQHQDQNSHNSSFFIRRDTAGRQSSEGPNQGEDDKWEGKKEQGAVGDFRDNNIMQEICTEEANKDQDPDHDTDKQRDLDVSSEAVPQWAGDDQIPVKQDGQQGAQT